MKKFLFVLLVALCGVSFGNECTDACENDCINECKSIQCTNHCHNKCSNLCANQPQLSRSEPQEPAAPLPPSSSGF